MCPYGRAHWHHLANMIELVLPLAHPSPQSKWQIDRFSCFRTGDRRVPLYFAMGAPFCPKIAPSHGRSGPHLTRFLGPIRAHKTNGISIGSAIFAQMTAECPCTLQWDAPSPLTIVPSHEGIWTPSNTWFPGPTRVLNQNGISIGSAVLAGLTSVTDRPTADRPRYSVGNNRPHLPVRTSTVMRPNNTNISQIYGSSGSAVSKLTL